MTPELIKVIAENLRLKSRILSVFFLLIFLSQAIIISVMIISKGFNNIGIPRMALIGPFMMMGAMLLEAYAAKYFRKLSQQKKKFRMDFIYLITFIEISFPTLIFLSAGILARNSNLLSVQQILTSPPLIIYFIMIILSALIMNFRLSVFAGITAGIQYLVISLYLMDGEIAKGIDIPNSIVRSVLILIFGIISGLVSKKILESVLSSLESKNKLIFELDAMVNEKTREVVLQKEELAIKNKDITDSINYARRIQQGIMPSEEVLSQTLREHFILYLPKDIVSGDFYWCGNSTDGKSLVAAIDCTGHGVPGAFMSMLGNTLLQHAAKDNKVNSPADLLDFLNRELPDYLRSHGQETSIKDGMDMALCAIDYKSMELCFSGANNPCWIVRKGELIELKGDKQAISASNEMEKKSFRNQVFRIEKEDCIYIFTDGYADQFGGEKGKKFKYKQLSEILLLHHSMNMDQQKKLLIETMNNWRGNLEQVDDQLIIGLRI